MEQSRKRLSFKTQQRIGNDELIMSVKTLQMIWPKAFAVWKVPPTNQRKEASWLIFRKTGHAWKVPESVRESHSPTSAFTFSARISSSINTNWLDLRSALSPDWPFSISTDRSPNFVLATSSPTLNFLAVESALYSHLSPTVTSGSYSVHHGRTRNGTTSVVKASGPGDGTHVQDGPPGRGYLHHYDPSYAPLKVSRLEQSHYRPKTMARIEWIIPVRVSY